MFCTEELQCLFGFTGTQSPPAEVHQIKNGNRLTTTQEHSRTRAMTANYGRCMSMLLNVRCLSHLTSILVYNGLYRYLTSLDDVIFVQGIFFEVAESLNILHQFWWFRISTNLEASSAEVTMSSCSRCSPVHTHSSDCTTFRRFSEWQNLMTTLWSSRYLICQCQYCWFVKCVQCVQSTKQIQKIYEEWSLIRCLHWVIPSHPWWLDNILWKLHCLRSRHRQKSSRLEMKGMEKNDGKLDVLYQGGINKAIANIRILISKVIISSA